MIEMMERCLNLWISGKIAVQPGTAVRMSPYSCSTLIYLPKALMGLLESLHIMIGAMELTTMHLFDPLPEIF